MRASIIGGRGGADVGLYVVKAGTG
jgi:hypothetical protein